MEIAYLDSVQTADRSGKTHSQAFAKNFKKSHHFFSTTYATSHGISRQKPGHRRATLKLRVSLRPTPGKRRWPRPQPRRPMKHATHFRTQTALTTPKWG